MKIYIADRSVPHVKQHLNQRTIAGIASRLKLFNEFFKWEILIGIRIQRQLAHSRHTFRKRGIP